MQTTELITYLNDLLKPSLFSDYAPNGLQVQGGDTIQTLVTGVTASLALIEKAIDIDADAILVHHGYFWKGESPAITHMKYKRLKALLSHDINLIAYHLPLDAHLRYGNNVLMANKIGATVHSPVTSENNTELLFSGPLERTFAPMDFSDHLAQTLNCQPIHIAADRPEIKQVAWCTGAAQDYCQQAASLGVDAFITGEVSERTYHEVLECNIHFYACGHHATERYGVQALGEHLAQQFSLAHHYVELDNPI